MTVHHSPPLCPPVFGAIILALLVIVPVVFADDYLGPVFPDDDLVYSEGTAPLPLPMPKRNPLLQRPGSKQVAFDDLDPTGSLIPQNLLIEQESDFLPQVTRKRQPPPSPRSSIMETGTPIFMDDTEMIQSGIIGNYPFEGDDCMTGSFPVAFGMGMFDNVSFFSESTAFKTSLNEGAGSFGFGEGINWSTALTPQGSVAGQYGIRAVQGDLFSRPARSQLFMTAGLFKRFDFARVQGGVAVDWLQDTSEQFRTINLRQMRCELSTRVFNSVECGFIGGFDVFGDRPKVIHYTLSPNTWHEHELRSWNYYQFFVRKHLDCGGQAELRCGTTERGELVMNALGEVAMNDRVAVNAGISMLAPSGGQSEFGNNRENWSMSLGIVIYFRGGASCRQINSYRPMFDVAGNNSLLSRMIVR